MNNREKKGVGIMLDIETLGTRPGCVVYQIGAVAFDLKTMCEVVVPFSVDIDPDSCVEYGLSVERETLEWHRGRGMDWLSLGGVSLRVGLIGFRSWLDDVARESGCGEFEFWCRGASFDFPVLEAAFRAADVRIPWMYWHQRCLRTVWKVCFGERKPDGVTAHVGLADCRAQLEQLRECLVRIEN